MPPTLRPLTLLCVLTIPLAAHSQISLGNPGLQDAKDAPPPPGGTLTGRVVFADTNGPARFAKVFLKPAKPSADAGDFLFSALAGVSAPKDSKKKLSPEEEAEKKQAQAASAKFMSAIADRMLSATIAADGIYLFTNVKAGVYYVHAQAPGYIDPLAAFSDEDLASSDPAMRQKVAAAAPTITVNGTEQAHADLRLERGASISGRVLYDDGTPAAGWAVRPLHDAPTAVQTLPGGMGIDLADLDLTHISEMSQTDDTGHFRIAGLSPGDYVLEARLTTSALGHSAFNPMTANSSAGGIGAVGGGFGDLMGLKLTVYSGNAVRRSDAVAVSVGPGDNRSGYDITMPLHTMRSIAGIVRAKSDAHPVNSGSVELTAQTSDGKPDPSLHLTASIQPDGSFHFDYVPGPATCIVKVARAADVTTTSAKKLFGSLIADQKTNHSYGPATATVSLLDTDIPDLKIDVPEQTTP